MKWHYTDGWNLDDFSTSVTISDDAELSAGQKTPFVQVASSAASKTLLLGLGEGDCMILMNSGNNAITVKNVEGDTGSSVAKGDIVLIVASETADATSVEVLNGSGGGGSSGGGVLVVNGTLDMEEGTVTLDKTYGEMESALEECPFAVTVINTPTGKTIYTLSIWSPYTVDSYYYAFDNMGSLLEFSGDNGTDYPVAQLGGGG